MNTRKGPKSSLREKAILEGVATGKPMKVIAYEAGVSIAALYAWVNARPALKIRIRNLRNKGRRPVSNELNWQRAKNEIARLEKIVANHPPYRPKSLKAPSDPKAAFQALAGYVEGLAK